ncbi:MAG: 50S rRNA methyltransferase [Chloroflexi bacterium]|nr:MAG: 50S rRNA methyltransferase [Chloroflexota bacterium]
MPQIILTCDPDFNDLALDEFHRDSVRGAPVAELAAGVWLAECDDGFWGLAETWQTKPPIFVRHLCPVDAVLPLTGTAADIASLADLTAADFADALDADMPYSVQSRVLAPDLPYKPFDLNIALSAALTEATGAPVDVRAPTQVLSVVCARLPDEKLSRFTFHVSPTIDHALSTTHYAFLGLSPTDLNLSDWAGGVRRFAREEGQISRAEFKLLEALEVFRIDLPPRGVALDLGAAPGGWTRVLRQREQFVTAVDPAELDPRLAEDKAVRHKRVTAEEYLADEPDEFDLIVNDMRMDARDSARLLVAYTGQLYRHGLALMTFKLPGEDRKRIIEHAFNILRQRYEILGARQLFHNRSEITVFLAKKG